MSRLFLMRKTFLLLFLLVSCVTPPTQTNSHPWGNSLRALDPVDASTPANDITAVYLRQQGDALQIRVDLLDFQNPSELSLDIRIEDDAAPQAHPLIIHIPSQTDSARIALDPELATVIIDILSPPSQPRMDISTPEDQINDLTLDSPVVTQSAPLLLAFYDTFAARLPAEALRSWDGAHTGPRGERHGLKHLLDAVEEYKVPVVLLDLKEKESLSALDAMGVLPRIRQGANSGLLILPDAERMADFNLPSSPFLYAPSTNPLDYKYFFALMDGAIHIYHSNEITYIPIPQSSGETQPTPDGPSLKVRRALLDTALNDDKADLLILGGSLANSNWGSPDMVGLMLAYFASRPYIHILNTNGLINFPTQSGKPDILTHPEAPIDELNLQSQSALEYAISWSESSPATSTAHCQPDLKFPECVLSNENFLAIFNPYGGQLVYLFTVENGTLHQLIGPSWQVAPGIEIYPGAFADDKDYQVTIIENSLIFTSTDDTRTKTFTFNKTGLDVTYKTQEPAKVGVPLLVDSWRRFYPGWADQYMQETTPNGIRWGLENGPMVSVHIVPVGEAENPIEIRAFNEGLSLLQGPEDPDFSYPPGHYVPFPMAIVEVDIQDGYFLRLERFPPDFFERR